MEHRSINLLRRDGTVAAVALVDRADFTRVGHHRWSLHPHGYAVRHEHGHPIYLHRTILGDAPSASSEADHVNRDKLDNRRANLRWLSHAENMQNRPKQKNGRSRYRGVMWDKRRQSWCGQIRRGGKKVWLRYYATEDEAGAAVAVARQALLPCSVERACR